MKRLAFALVMLLAAAAVAAPDDTDPEPPVKSLLVALKTNHGTITIELDAKKAPITVKNFLGYVDGKHYDGLVFHRVISTFMIQGGGYKKGLAAAQNPETLKAKTKDPIKNEASNGLSNARGTIAMARTVNADSATAQFYLNVVDNKRLDATNDNAGYCVFGKVVKGMDVVDKIKQVRTTKVGTLSDVPAEDVVIETARRVPK